MTKFFFTPSQCWIYKYTSPSTLRILDNCFLSFLVNLHLPLVFSTKRSFRVQETIQGIVILHTLLTALRSVLVVWWRSFSLVTVYWTTEHFVYAASWDSVRPVSKLRLSIIDQVTSKVHFMFQNLHQTFYRWPVLFLQAVIIHSSSNNACFKVIHIKFPPSDVVVF